jgi:nucleoside 2-deoxyribosyltransferase
VRRIETLFLAGPDRWFPDAAGHLERRRERVRAAGFTPLDGDRSLLVETQHSEAMAREIYASTLEQVRAADGLIVNLTPWRGPGADPGAAFLAGFASALGKPVFAYLNVPDDDEADHRERVGAFLGASVDDDGVWRDGQGAEIEDFGLPENLILWAEARRFYVVVTMDPFEELTGLELCLQAVALYSD